MRKILMVFGTRPEAVKMAPVVTALRGNQKLKIKVLVTAQHREMLDQVLNIFNIVPDYDLNVMRKGQTLNGTVETILHHIQPILSEEKPDWVLVQGDTTTAFAAALAAFYNRIKVGHVEAGLRTYDRNNPFPEEINRVLIDHISDVHFAPTERARQALLAERVSAERIHVTGNTVIDALQAIIVQPAPALPWIEKDERFILVTAHRRESFGLPFQRMCAAIRQIADRGDVRLLYPVHPNPEVQKTARELLGNHPRVTLLPPLDYLAFVHLMRRAFFILTDSGGIQEEAPSLGVPVLVMRETTERPEAVEAGTAKLVGTETSGIVTAANVFLDDPSARDAMSKIANPFGDGHAAVRIAEILEHF